jgi:hypothetical protein
LVASTCRFYAIPIAVPILNSTKTVIYKADSMWWHCYIFQRFVLVAVYSGWDAGLGQVEFRGTRGGGGTTEVPHSTARTDVKEICRENVAHLAAVWEKA